MTTCASYLNTRSESLHSFCRTANKSVPLLQQQLQEKLDGPWAVRTFQSILLLYSQYETSVIICNFM